MLTRRSPLLETRAALSATAVIAVTASRAEATPGFVDRSGCHGQGDKRHGHRDGQIRKAENGRQFVPMRSQ